MFNLFKFKKKAQGSPAEVTTPSIEAPPSLSSTSDPLSVLSEPRSHSSYNDDNDEVCAAAIHDLMRPSSQAEPLATPSPPPPAPTPMTAERETSEVTQRAAPPSNNSRHNTDLRSIIDQHNNDLKVWGLSKIRHDVSMESDAGGADDLLVASRPRNASRERQSRTNNRPSSRDVANASNSSMSPPRAPSSAKRTDRKSSHASSSSRMRRDSDRKSSKLTPSSGSTDRRSSSKHRSSTPAQSPASLSHHGNATNCNDVSRHTQPSDSETSNRSGKKTKLKREKRPPPVTTHAPRAPASSNIDLKAIMADSDVASPGELLSPVPSMSQLGRRLKREAKSPTPAEVSAVVPKQSRSRPPQQSVTRDPVSTKAKSSSCDMSAIDLVNGVMTIPIHINLASVRGLQDILQLALERPTSNASLASSQPREQEVFDDRSCAKMHLNVDSVQTTLPTQQPPPRSPSTNPSANTNRSDAAALFQSSQQPSHKDRPDFADLTGSEKMHLPAMRIPKKSKQQQRPDTLDLASGSSRQAKRRTVSPAPSDDGRKRRRHNRDRSDASPSLARNASTGFSTRYTDYDNPE